MQYSALHARVVNSCAALLISSGIIAGFSSDCRAAAVQARPAYDMVNSFGVSTHFGWGGTPYDNGFTTLKNMLRDLGIRHIRDIVENSRTVSRVADLNRSLGGVRMTADIDDRRGSGSTQRLYPNDIAGSLALLKSYLPISAIQSIGSANEYNNLERFYGYKGWPQELRSYHAKLYDLVKSDPQLKNIPITAPCIAMTETQSFFKEIGDMTATSDHGCGHIYSNWMTVTDKIASSLPNLRLQSGNNRINVTETGYHTATNGGGQYYDEPTKAKALGRLMVEFFAEGQIDKVYLYQLVDPYPDPGKTSNGMEYGLIDYNLVRRPAYFAVRSMMAVMCDQKLAFTPHTLSYRLSGNLNNVRTLLFEKNNRAFYFLNWLQLKTYFRGAPVNNPAQAVTITFDQPIASARLYMPTDPPSNPANGYVPRRTYTNPSSITLSVMDQVGILEIIPRGVSVPATPSFCSFQPS